MTAGRANSAAPKKEDPAWAPWIGLPLGILAIILKATGQGIARAAILFCIIAPVALAIRMWGKTPPARRPVLFYAPIAIAVALVVIFITIPIGGPSADNPGTGGVCPHGYTQQGDCLPGSQVPGDDD
jgi:hypothetical protein